MLDLCRNDTWLRGDGEAVEVSGLISLSNRLSTLKSLKAILLASAFATALPSFAAAQTVWDGSNSANWFEGGNWSTGAVPTAADDAMIDLSSPGARISGGNAFADTVYVGGSGTGHLDIASGGRLTSRLGWIGMEPGSLGVVDIAGQWSNDQLIVGFDGEGAVNVLNGGHMSSKSAFIGSNEDAVGVVTVQTSQWASGNLSVGTDGYGSLQIENRGVVLTTVASIGTHTGGKGGAVTLTGLGSVWALNGELTVGEGTNGTLTISDGGFILGSGTSIGQLASGTGIATVTGARSIWDNRGDDLFIGDAGHGRLTVLDGAGVSGRSGFVGRAAGSVGSVSVSGTGSRWNMSSVTLVGEAGDGKLLIEKGGLVTSDDAGVIGSLGVGRGSVVVTGAGSQWINGGPLTIGRDGNGNLTIGDGGKVSNSRGTVGEYGTGEVLIAGADSMWTGTGPLTVGEFGKGTITVAAGGTLTSADTLIGKQSGALGAVSISGSGSTWAVSSGDDIEIGVSGTGTLSITDGGKVGSGLVGRIAKNAGSIGSVLVSGAGSLWGMTVIAVGDEGTGTMLVENGGKVTSQIASIGDSGPGKGVAVIRGAGSTWTNTGPDLFLVGYEADGAVTVTAAGTLVTGDAKIGSEASGVGKVFVTGAGSTWAMTLADDVDIGTSGSGSLVVGDGGKVAGGFIGRIAKNAGSTGSVLVSGINSLWSMELIAVGDEGNGTLIVENGGTVVSGFASIGDSGPGKGLAIVRGAGSTWTSRDVADSIYVAYEADGTLTVAEGGKVVSGEGAGEIKIAVKGSARGTLNIGSGLGETPVAPGTIAAKTVSFGAGIGAINFNHTGTDYVFASALTGRGNIDLVSGTTVLTGNSSDFLGTTSVVSAKLVVNGHLGGTLGVQANGWLAGSGTVGTTSLASAATVAPGNSIGTLSVAGDISFAAGSTYQVEVGDGGRSDFIDVAGRASLNGGNVAVIPLAGFVSDSRYKILSADGGVSGTFGGLSLGLGRSAFLTPSLSYDANNVFLAIDQTATLDSAGSTPNQIATARGLDSLAAGNPLLETVLQLDAPGARAAFDQLSGELHASLKGVLLEDSRLLRDAMVARLREQAIADDGTAVHGIGAVPGGPTLGGVVLWGRAMGSWGKSPGDGNAAALDHSTGGILLGADAELNDATRVGILAGYGRTSFDADARGSSGNSDNAYLGIYGGAVFDRFAVRTGAAYSWHDITTRRYAAFAGFDQKLTAGYDGGTAQIFGEIGYQLQAGGIALEPFANLAYVNLHTDAFTEDGGTGALAGSSTTADATSTTLGVRAVTDFVLGDARAMARGMVGWRRLFGDRIPGGDFSFASGNVFSIAGVPLARDAAVLEAGIDVAISPSAKFGVLYSGQFGGGARDHGIRADFALKF